MNHLKRYLVVGICIVIFTALKSDWGPGPHEPLVLFRVEEDYSFSFGSALPGFLALAVMAYQMLIAKKENWIVILASVSYLILFLANL